MSTVKKDIEDDLKIGNWLSVLTYDAFKYAKAGGEMLVKHGENGITIELPNATLDDPNINKKFRGLVSKTAVSVV